MKSIKMNDPVLNPTKIESPESVITEGSFIRSSVKNGNIFKIDAFEIILL